jgi:probable addiction module antidote protein
VESLRKDSAFAAEYLNVVREDGDQEELMAVLRRMADAFGGIQKLAGKAKLNANILYRTLSPKGNPEFKSLRSVLRAMRMQLTVRPLNVESPSSRQQVAPDEPGRRHSGDYYRMVLDARGNQSR